jgi:hypothetical protein
MVIHSWPKEASSVVTLPLFNGHEFRNLRSVTCHQVRISVPKGNA